MSMRTTAVVVGLLFLTSTAAFAASAQVAGVLLVAYTGLAVAAIGIAMFPVLTPHGPGLARGYLVLRIAEGVALLAVAVYVATSGHPVTGYEPLVHAFTGAGELVLSWLLLRSGLVPRWLAVLGLVGYAALLAGVVSQLTGLSRNGRGRRVRVPRARRPVRAGAADPIAGQGFHPHGQRGAAMTAPGRFAGIGLLAMSLLAGFANFGVIERVTTPADTATTQGR